MITISLCMIVKNEQDVLARCLDSVKDIVDEIIIVDTGSSDRTIDIAKSYTTHLKSFEWNNNFSDARNFSFSMATKEYCMWLDADDVLASEDQKKLINLKRTLSKDVDIVMMKYHTAFDEEGNPTFTYYRERLIRNDGTHHWGGVIHEAMELTGKIIYSDIAVQHRKIKAGDPDRNLHIFQALIRQGKQLNAREEFYYGRELYYHQQYEQAISVLTNFLRRTDGWIENQIDACMVLSDCYSLTAREKDAWSILCYSFQLDIPRAEICCRIGFKLLEQQKYRMAVFWYQLCFQLEKKEQSGGFVSNDCYGFIPCIQLCVCYDRMGDLKTACWYNERAALYKPNSPLVIHNRAYFEDKGYRMTDN